MGKLLFISCAEAKSICDKDQYGEATDWEKLTSGLSDAIKNSIKYEFEKALKGTK
jgi:hypothetical protein